MPIFEILKFLFKPILWLMMIDMISYSLFGLFAIFQAIFIGELGEVRFTGFFNGIVLPLILIAIVKFAQSIKNSILKPFMIYAATMCITINLALLSLGWGFNDDSHSALFKGFTLLIALLIFACGRWWISEHFQKKIHLADN